MGLGSPGVLYGICDHFETHYDHLSLSYGPAALLQLTAWFKRLLVLLAVVVTSPSYLVVSL